MRNQAALTIAGLAMGLAFSLTPQYALAFGSESQDERTVEKCEKGYAWNEQLQRCVKLETGALDNDDLYAQGWKLAKSGAYEKAIELLSYADQDDPRVLNYLGFSHRKMGKLDKGIAYYQEALAIDPDFVLAREYLGEGYVSAGKLSLARAELDEIEKRCGQDCEEYQELAAVIESAQ